MGLLGNSVFAGTAFALPVRQHIGYFSRFFGGNLAYFIKREQIIVVSQCPRFQSVSCGAPTPDKTVLPTPAANAGGNDERCTFPGGRHTDNMKSGSVHTNNFEHHSGKGCSNGKCQAGIIDAEPSDILLPLRK